MGALRNWLRRSPEPHSIRIRTEDDEERTIALETGRYRYRAAEEAITNARAVVVECIASDGKVLRSRKLEYEAGEAAEPEELEEKKIGKAVARAQGELANVLDRFGDRLNQAFDRGASAANTGQENLVGLVEVLTNHLSLAITNLHNVSVNLANIVAQAGGGEPTDTNGQALQQLLTMVAGRALQGQQPAEPRGNGTAKKPPNGGA